MWDGPRGLLVFTLRTADEKFINPILVCGFQTLFRIDVGLLVTDTASASDDEQLGGSVRLWSINHSASQECAQRNELNKSLITNEVCRKKKKASVWRKEGNTKVQPLK